MSGTKKKKDDKSTAVIPDVVGMGSNTGTGDAIGKVENNNSDDSSDDTTVVTNPTGNSNDSDGDDSIFPLNDNGDQDKIVEDFVVSDNLGVGLGGGDDIDLGDDQNQDQTVVGDEESHESSSDIDLGDDQDPGSDVGDDQEQSSDDQNQNRSNLLKYGLYVAGGVLVLTAVAGCTLYYASRNPESVVANIVSPDAMDKVVSGISSIISAILEKVGMSRSA